jgi:hypothetical protein
MTTQEIVQSVKTRLTLVVVVVAHFMGLPMTQPQMVVLVAQLKVMRFMFRVELRRFTC